MMLPIAQAPANDKASSKSSVSLLRTTMPRQHGWQLLKITVWPHVRRRPPQLVRVYNSFFDCLHRLGCQHRKHLLRDLQAEEELDVCLPSGIIANKGACVYQPTAFRWDSKRWGKGSRDTSIRTLGKADFPIELWDMVLWENVFCLGNDYRSPTTVHRKWFKCVDVVDMDSLL